MRLKFLIFPVATTKYDAYDCLTFKTVPVVCLPELAEYGNDNSKPVPTMSHHFEVQFVKPTAELNTYGGWTYYKYKKL